MKTINVLMFPGTNCEVETARALRKAGFASEVLRWNEDPNKVAASDGLVIAGGFSYEDRGRSGVVAAKSPIRSVILAMAAAGKPILGICNGAQILIEMGLIPGLNTGNIEMALARNRRQKNEEILGSGFYHAFSYIKPAGKKTAWTDFEEPVKMPVAHGEGRFLASIKILKSLEENGQDCLIYCDASGQKAKHFPENPNGSLLSLAGVSNVVGNVVAMMPHPERSAEGQKVFRSLHRYFDETASKGFEPLSAVPPSDNPFSPQEKAEYPLELYVSLKITDNAEKTLEETARTLYNVPDLKLSRYQFWGITPDDEADFSLPQFLKSEEFYNENKEAAYIKWQGKWFRIENGQPRVASFPAYPQAIIASESDDVLGEEKAAQLRKHADIKAKVTSGIYWGFSEPIDEKLLFESALFGNPVSWELTRA